MTCKCIENEMFVRSLHEKSREQKFVLLYILMDGGMCNKNLFIIRGHHLSHSGLPATFSNPWFFLGENLINIDKC